MMGAVPGKRETTAARILTIFFAVAAVLTAGQAHTGELKMSMELRGGLIYMPVSINGSEETLAFILDSGAMMSALDPETAARLGLEAVGQAQAMGAGSETHDISIFRADSLTVGDASFEDVMFAGVPLAPLTIHTGGALDGVLGYNVLSAYAVDIDYENEVVTFHDPAEWTYEGGGNEVPLHFKHNLPFVYAGIEEESDEIHKKHEGLFVLDTGASPALIVNHDFAERNRLYSLSETLIEAPTGFGIGGAVHGKVGRLPELRIGASALSEPVTHFSTETKGALAYPDMAGVIGAKVLSRFRTIIDYPGARLILEPNESLHDPFDYDALGAHFVKRDGIIEVYAVLPGTPAVECGLEPGDRLVSIDGKAASDIGLEGIEEMFLIPGTTYTLELERSGKAMTRKASTRKLL